ncbi:ribonuclease H-like domain-containing protein [Mycena amicta]|nr:ribonuclease H-like domain-containing protein [Mycena amicta]
MSKGRASIKSLLLSNDEWQLLYQVQNVLVPFKAATLRISTNKFPRLSEVIPILDILNNHLESVANQTHSDIFTHPTEIKATKPTKAPPKPKRREMFAVVRVAAVKALGIADKYYAKTDDSIMYRGAMLLDPRYRLSYFKKAGWEQAWIDQAVEFMRKQWVDNYRVDDVSDDNTETPAHASIFASLDDEPINTDPFEHFIADTPIPKANCHDPLLWWGKFSPYSTPAALKSPNNVALIQMAQDFVGAPATSVDIEHAFSHAGGMVTKRHHALSSDTIRANSLVAAWSKADLIPWEDVVKRLNTRRSRKPNDPVIEVSDGDDDADSSIDLVD